MNRDYEGHVQAVQFLKKAEEALASHDTEMLLSNVSECLELDPSIGRAMELRGLTSILEDDMERARLDLEGSLRFKGNHDLSRLAIELMGSVEWPLQKDQMGKLARLQLLGNGFISSRLWNEAALCYLAIEKEVQPNWSILSVLGLIHRELGNLEPSLAYYGKALQQPDAPGEILHDRGVVLFKMGRFVDAEKDFEKVSRIKGDSPMVWNNMGSVQEAQGKDGEAAMSYMKAIEIDGNYYPALYSMGRVLQKQGRMEEARVFMDKALDIEGRVYDMDDVKERGNREEDDDIHVKEIMTEK